MVRRFIVFGIVCLTLMTGGCRNRLGLLGWRGAPCGLRPLFRGQPNMGSPGPFAQPGCGMPTGPGCGPVMPGPGYSSMNYVDPAGMDAIPAAPGAFMPAGGGPFVDNGQAIHAMPVITAPTPGPTEVQNRIMSPQLSGPTVIPGPESAAIPAG